MNAGYQHRFLPDEPLPPYAFVPGQNPHPISDPRGHSHGRVPEPILHFDLSEWMASKAYLYGIDLFNHGYYWEAHEAWESLWHAVGRRGLVADFLKGLIKLAAAGVKMRDGNWEGVRSHANRAAELFRGCVPLGERVMGLGLAATERLAHSIAADHAEEITLIPIIEPKTEVAQANIRS